MFILLVICIFADGFFHALKEGIELAGAFEIVMSERKFLVDKIISMMKQGEFFHV